MNRLKKAIEETGLSKRKLSVKIGRSQNYLSRVMKHGVTTAKQNEILNRIKNISNESSWCDEMNKLHSEHMKRDIVAIVFWTLIVISLLLMLACFA